jgi:hypothetical protein
VFVPVAETQLDDDWSVDTTNGELLEGCFFELAGSENNHVEGAPASIDDQLGETSAHPDLFP